MSNISSSPEADDNVVQLFAHVSMETFQSNLIEPQSKFLTVNC